MTGESPDRPTQRMSRFSQVYRDRMPPGTVLDPILETERTSERGNAAGAADPLDWQRYGPADPYAEAVEETIEVEFETVEPRPAQRDDAPLHPRAYANGNGTAAAQDALPASMQPPPPDIEAIAAALAEEMDRNAARGVRPSETPAVEAPAAIEAAAAALPVAVEPAALPAPNGPAALPAPAPSAGKTALLLDLAAKSAQFARAKAGPAVVNGAFWLAHNLRRREIRRRYGKAVAMTHSKVLDRRLEKHFFIPSLQAERYAPDGATSILYEGPVPAAVFGWVLAAMPADLREYAFVDFRAGLGRAMLLASQCNFERIIGYEHDLALYDDLQMNIAQFPRSKMLCRDVQCFRADRSGISIPEQPCVLYFSNAWREDLLGGIMSYVAESYRHKPRRLYIVLENVDEKTALAKDEIFYRLDLPLAEKLKLRLFSPMDFQVYRTLA